MFFVRILGPVIGLLVGSKLNTVYVNFNRNKIILHSILISFSAPQGLTVVDPMWIGCWWLGFLIFGIVLFFPAVALAMFPTDNLEEEEEEAVALNGKDEKGELLKMLVFSSHPLLTLLSGTTCRQWKIHVLQPKQKE